MGHSFGALVLGNTISHSILGANGEGGRSSSPWDMAVAFNSADNSITTRQLMQEFDYLYKYDPQKHAYVSRGNLGEDATTVSENRPALVLLQSENDSATGQIFPIGTGTHQSSRPSLPLAEGPGARSSRRKGVRERVLLAHPGQQ